ncbi:MAG TPA: HAMP domain-containing sensor histidine kinase [Verrucomicrobiae bacterium]|nr:HAMP domain-containing sensor histidine kinase [Verrucomicrobiae bacterium]
MLALLVIVVAVAIGCVLWFMREAMQNERMAVREKLAEAYRGQLTFARARVVAHWNDRLAQLDLTGPPPARFVRCVLDGLADSVICFDEQGRAVYPTVVGGNRDTAANAELLALESESQEAAHYRDAIIRLGARVNDYGTNSMSSTQRRFLMHELGRLQPGMTWPTLPAEELAGRFLDANPRLERGPLWHVGELPDVWAVFSPSGRVLGLFRQRSLVLKLMEALPQRELPPGVSVFVTVPGEESPRDTAVVSVNLSPELPGWGLWLVLDDRKLFDTEAERRAAHYFAIGSIVSAAMLVLAFFMARGFGRQVKLARLKNDLVATVSHELKTPLTAMRALVDTLLDSERLDEKTTREYLNLLATENARLSRLIENFLTFSRLERNKFKFVFARVRPEEIVEGAVAAMGERAHAPGCTVEQRVAAELPEITGDADALVTALLNLLDNAWKYSGDPKHILVCAEARDGYVDFAVEDNGIGLSAGEQRRVFDRFYQADQRLARTVGGCGLGLSIVQAIVEAHHGRVRVDSAPGRGSTFTIEIPVVTEGAS